MAILSSFFMLYASFCSHCCWVFSESDYAVMARNFEDHVDDKVLEAVLNATVAETAAAAAAPAAAGNVGAIQCLRS